MSNVEKLKKSAEKAEKEAAAKRNQLLFKLTEFFAKDKTVTYGQKGHYFEGGIGWSQKNKFFLPALTPNHAERKAQEFIFTYTNILKGDYSRSQKPDECYECIIKPNEDGKNCVFINRNKSLGFWNAVKEIDKMFQPYGKALIKHWNIQTQLGNTQKTIPIIRDHSR